MASGNITTSDESHAESQTTASISLHEQVTQWEHQLLNEYDKISLHDAEALLMRCVKLSQVLVATVQKKQKEEREKREQEESSQLSSITHEQADMTIANESSSIEESNARCSVQIPAEVLRLIIPHLAPNEMGRLFLLTSPYMVPMLDPIFVWKELCLKLWPDFMTSQLGGANWWIQATTTSSSDQRNVFQWYFQQRQKKILLQQDGRLKPLPKPKWNPDYLTLAIDIYNDKGQLVYTRTMDNFLSQVDDFLSNGTVTVHLEEPILVGSLPRGRGCHCWNLPKSYPGWRARLHLFADTNDATEDDDDIHANNSFHGRQCHTLLDTGLSVWRGFSENGELTFVQKERTKGLQLTDRGRFLHHRIVTGSSRTPNWRNFLGFQAKVILVCEKTYVDGGNSNGTIAGKVSDEDVASTFNPIQHFGFTSLKIQAIRLHENSAGNIHHTLFRKDSGWHKHGVDLLHLLEELV